MSVAGDNPPRVSQKAWEKLVESGLVSQATPEQSPGEDTDEDTESDSSARLAAVVSKLADEIRTAIDLSQAEVVADLESLRGELQRQRAHEEAGSSHSLEALETLRQALDGLKAEVAELRRAAERPVEVVDMREPVGELRAAVTALNQLIQQVGDDRRRDAAEVGELLRGLRADVAEVAQRVDQRRGDDGGRITELAAGVLSSLEGMEGRLRDIVVERAQALHAAHADVLTHALAAFREQLADDRRRHEHEVATALAAVGDVRAELAALGQTLSALAEATSRLAWDDRERATAVAPERSPRAGETGGRKVTVQARVRPRQR